MPRIAELEIAVATTGLAKTRGELAALERQTKGVATTADRVGKRAGSALGTGMKVGAVAAGASLFALGIAARRGFDEIADGARKTAQTNAVLKSTHGVANITAQGVQDLATRLSDLSGVDDQVVQSGENMLLTFTNIRNETGKGNDIFNRATTTALGMSVALGEDATSAAMQLGKALNDPVRGITALRRVGVAFTDAQQDQIKALVKSGDSLKAQKIILGELTKEFGGSAEAAGKTLPGAVDRLNNSLDNLFAAVLEPLLPSLQGLVGLLASAAAFSDKHRTATRVLVAAVAGLSVAFLAAAGAMAINNSALLTMVKSQRIATLGARAYAAAQWLVNAALSANPIGIVVVALAALAVGLVVAYKRSETFRNIVNGAFNAVKRVVGAVTDFIIDHWRTLILFIPGIGPALRLVVDNFGTMRRGIRAVVDGIAGIWRSAKEDAASAWRAVYTTAVSWINKLLSAYNWVANHLPGIDPVALLSTGGGGGGRDTRGGRPQAGQHRAVGGIVKAVPGGVYRVSEAGHDEAVVSLDPAHRRRSKEIIFEASRRLGLVPQFQLGGIAHTVGQAAESAAGAVGGAASAAWGAFSDPRAFLLRHLPGIPGSVPEPAHAMLEYIRRRLVGAGVSEAQTGVIARAAREALRMSALRRPYLWGGGHGGFDPDGPWDCSGAVSQVLHAAGLLNSPEVSGSLMSWGRAGRGALEVLANPEHVYMLIAGRGFGTSSGNPGGGFGPVPYAERPGFAVRHYAGGGTVAGPAGSPQLVMAHGGEQIDAAWHKHSKARKGGRGDVTVNVYLPRGSERWNERQIGRFLGEQLAEAL